MARKPNIPLPTHDGRTFTWTGKRGVAEATGKRDASGNPEVRQFLLEVWPSGDGTSLRLMA